METRRIFVACRLSRGSFSGEAVFEIETDDGEKYVGVAPLRDCRTADGSSITPSDFPERESIEGKLVTRLIANGGDIARIALPDGEAVKVPATAITERESEIAHVSL